MHPGGKGTGRAVEFNDFGIGKDFDI